MEKVNFVGTDRLIIVKTGVTFLDVRDDLYSAWKRWLVQGNNTKYLPALRYVGGEPTVSGQFLGTTFFLTNGWRIRPWEGNHRITINGNLFTDEGEGVFVRPLGDFMVEINSNTSSLLERVSTSTETGTGTDVAARLDEMAAKLNVLLSNDLTQSMQLTKLVDEAVHAGFHMHKLEDLTYQILGLSRSNFKIVNPVYKDGGITTSTVQTFKSREDMLRGQIFKSYRMTSDFDDLGRLSMFRIIETELSAAGSLPGSTQPVEPLPHTSPVSTSPVSTSPVSTSPVSTSPVSTSPVSTEPASPNMDLENAPMNPDTDFGMSPNLDLG